MQGSLVVEQSVNATLTPEEKERKVLNLTMIWLTTTGQKSRLAKERLKLLDPQWAEVEVRVQQAENELAQKPFWAGVEGKAAEMLED